MQAGLIMTRELQPPPVGPGRAGKHRTQVQWESRREPEQDSRYKTKTAIFGHVLSIDIDCYVLSPCAGIMRDALLRQIGSLITTNWVTF